MRAHPLVAAIALGSTLLYAEDFSLTKDGFGPITVHTTVTYEGKGERMAATAVNDSGQLIPYVKLCLVADTKGCLFEMWNTEPWEPGKKLDWNVTASRHVPNLSHEVKIEALNLPPEGPAAGGHPGRATEAHSRSSSHPSATPATGRAGSDQ